MKPHIENVVGVSACGVPVDLDAVHGALDGADYNPESFPGMVIRLVKPKVSILVFRSGKMVISGGKSAGMIADGANAVCSILRRVGVAAADRPKSSVTNIVATAYVGKRIRLEAVARTLPRSMYEPEIFPGLVQQVLDPKCTILLFHSGRFVCVGTKRTEDTERAVSEMCLTLERRGLLHND